MLDVSSFWDLIEQRARTTPGARMAVDETGRVMTYAQYRDDAGRAGAGDRPSHLPPSSGIGASHAGPVARQARTV